MINLPRILLVEDSKRDAEMVLKALEMYNLANQVLHLRDGDEALDFFFRRGAFADRPEGLPAVLLLDLKMPKVDGLEVARQLRAEPSMSKIPIVIMTSSRQGQDVAESYAAGVNAYVVKPVKFADFVDTVRQVGRFWGALNEPPPGSRPLRAPPNE